MYNSIMRRRSPLLGLAWLPIVACGPRLHSTPAASPTAPTGSPAARATAITTATTASPPLPTTASLPPAPTFTAPPATTTEAPPAIADDLVPACRFNCDALRNACGVGDVTGCYQLCDEYDRTLIRACRSPMAAYFRCLAWTASCVGGQPRSDTSKCAADKAAFDTCKG